MGSSSPFPDTTVLEIRPQRSLRRNDGALGGAKDLLGFTAMHIDSWIEQGYHDTMSALDSVHEAASGTTHSTTFQYRA